jgi:hypothetical protein
MKKWLTVPTVAALLAIGALAQTPAKERGTTTPKPQTNNTIRLLNQRIPEVAFDAVPFEQVMDWVKEVTGANVVVRWQMLVDAGIEREKPITVKVKNLRLSQVLWMIMNEAGGTDIKLAYRASGSVLVLSTEADLGKEMVLKVYDISDLLIKPTNFYNAARMDPSQMMQNMGSGQGGGGGGQQLFQGGMGNEQNRTQDQTTGGADLDAIVQLIMDTVEPDTWQRNGGTGQIYPFRTSIVVYANLLVHQRLGGYTQEGAVGP